MIPAEIVFLCFAAFAAGFIDAIVGGGGLIQTPATLISLPQYPVATLLGTTKIPSFIGTSMAAMQYARIVKLRWKLLAMMCSIALVAAYAGSKTVSLVPNTFMKPVIFGMLIVVFIYTYSKKDFGIATVKSHKRRKELLYAGLFAVATGFYDGFIGPGAGSFLVLFFISGLGFDLFIPFEYAYSPKTMEHSTSLCFVNQVEQWFHVQDNGFIQGTIGINYQNANFIG